MLDYALCDVCIIIIVTVVVVRIDRKSYGTLYVSFILENKDKDIKNDYRICNYGYDWPVYVIESLLLMYRYCVLTLIHI